MASFETGGLDGLILSMAELARIPTAVQDEMLNAQADVIAPQQKIMGRSMGVYRTGQTLASIRKGRPRQRKGVRFISVSPVGKNRKGQANAEIAYLNQYGVPRRRQPARPFITRANEQAARAAEDAGARVFFKWQESIDL